MKRLFSLALAGMLAASLCACGDKTYKDGTYTARSSEHISDDSASDEGNGYGEVEITIKDGKISACTFKTYEIDGTPKGEDYGKEGGEIKNKDYYQRAQRANKACENYARQLVAKGELDGVDLVTGATINYNEFKEAVEAALKQAEK
ncbi:MAG: FMN-binding protein [Ruminococcus sp.]|nr:FMN-binding protein [Ruminococcus sp.]